MNPVDTFFTDAPLLMTTIESPGPRLMPCMDEDGASGVVFTSGQPPGDKWELVTALMNDRRRYFHGRYVWRRAMP